MGATTACLNKNTVYAADGTAFDSTDTERYLYAFLGSIGALSPGMESTVPLSRKFYTGGEGPFKELALVDRSRSHCKRSRRKHSTALNSER